MSFGHLGTLGTGFSRMGSGGGQAGAIIVLSVSTIAEDASVGDLVGLLSVAGGSGSYTFTMDVNDYFELDAGDDTRVEVKAALTAGSLPITVQADNGVDDLLERTFTITVTDVAEIPLDRLSSVHIALPWRGLYQFPDGAIAVSDRQTAGGMYGGV